MSRFCRWIALPCVLVLAGACSAYGQISAALQVPRKMHLAGEPVNGVVTITNHAGRTLVFQGDGRFQWLNFQVKDSAGNTINPRQAKPFGPLKIEAGQTLSRKVELTQFFHLTEPGNYSVIASIREPREEMSMIHTNKAFFVQSTGSTQWSQKIGLGDSAGATREYRLVHFTDESKSYLYAQIREGSGGRPLQTFRLGEVLMLRRPLATVDRGQRMHAMFLGTPTMWVHCVVDQNGRLVGSQIHQRAAIGDPRLVPSGDGSVQVVNSIPYDPAAAQREKGKIRKATDRPIITY